jgi:hypothetical protein
MSILRQRRGCDDDKPCRGRGCPRPGTVVTSARAPAFGDLAWSLACGANLSVPNGRAWNLLVDPHMPVENAQEALDMWGIRSPRNWHETMHRLLGDAYGDRNFEYVLRLRRRIWEWQRQVPELTSWQQYIVKTAESGGIDRAKVGRLTGVAARIARYERAFADDGLVAPMGGVTSVLAYDWARAIHLAFWAVATGLVDEPTARSAILRAGQMCALRYLSWPDMSAGYSLGRVLAFDDDKFGDDWYGECVRTHRALARATDGPWSTLPWRPRVVA